MTTAPIVAKGKSMVGVSGGEWGIRGFVVALDARTGEEAWKAYSIPSPDQPGGNSWPGDTWRTGGAPIWLPGTYDPELNLTYWGTGNAGPWMGDQRTGDNLYTNLGHRRGCGHRRAARVPPISLERLVGLG